MLYDKYCDNDMFEFGIDCPNCLICSNDKVHERRQHKTCTLEHFSSEWKSPVSNSSSCSSLAIIFFFCSTLFASDMYRPARSNSLLMDFSYP